MPRPNKPNSLFRLSVGNVLFPGSYRGVGELHLAAVSRLDVVASHLPVFGIGDGACGFGLDIEMVQPEVDQLGIGIRTYVEGLFGSQSLDVPDVNIREMWQTFCRWCNWSSQNDPVARRILYIGRQRGIVVARIPVHRHVDRNSYALQVEVVNTNIRGIAAASMRGFEEEARRNATERCDVVGLDVVETAGGLRPNGDSRSSMTDDRIANDDIFRRTIDAKTIGVSTRF